MLTLLCVFFNGLGLHIELLAHFLQQMYSDHYYQKHNEAELLYWENQYRRIPGDERLNSCHHCML